MDFIKKSFLKNSRLNLVIPGIIIFKIAELEFCINVRDVNVIKRLEDPSDLKKSSLNDLSYLTIYNINIPIVDISKFFSITAKNEDENKVILIIRHSSEDESIEKTYGILVDSVKEIINMNKSDDSYFLKFFPSNDNSFLSGTMLWGNRKILLPDFSKITGELFRRENKVQ